MTNSHEEVCLPDRDVALVVCVAIAMLPVPDNAPAQIVGPHAQSHVARSGKP
jgi:hypothetical protein